MTGDSRKKILFFSILAFLGLALPLHFASAFIAELASNIFFGIFAILFQVEATLAMAAVGIVAYLLNWAMSPSGVIFLPYTSGGIVDTGWAIMRDLANMGLVLGLIVIGLATALRYGDYQAKKALPRLLAMAILINFTPVIVGLIVDAGNIIMKFFLTETIGWDAFVRVIQGLWSGADNFFSWETVVGFFTQPLALTTIAKAIAINIFAFITASFLLLYFFLFVMRYVAIWLLVIVSPLAFFCWIFPATKSYFEQWWHQFINWNFIGVAAAFVLYLSQQLMVLVSSGRIVAPPPSGDPLSSFLGIGSVLTNMLPYTIVDVFMLVGFMGALSSSAMGANGVIATTKSLMRTVPAAAGRGAKSWAGAQLMQSRWGKGAMNIANRLALAKTPGTGATTFGGKVANFALNPLWAAGRAMGRQAGQALTNAKNKIDATEMEVKKLTVDEAASKFLGSNDLATQIGILNAQIKEGKLGDFRDRLKQSGLSDPQIDAKLGKILQQSENQYGKIDAHKELLSAMPESPEAKKIFEKQAAEAVAKNTGVAVSAVTPAQIAAELPNQYKSFFKKMKPERAANINPDVYDPGSKINIPPGQPGHDPALYNPDASQIAEAAALGWRGAHAEKAIDVHGVRVADAIREQVKKMAGGANHLEWLKTNNSGLANYVFANAILFKLDVKGKPNQKMMVNPTPPPPLIPDPTDTDYNPHYGTFA